MGTTVNNGCKAISKEEGKMRDHYVSDVFPAGLRVLVVDDDQPCLFIVERMLKKCEYKVTKCQQPKDALTLLREDKNRFDIVVIDLHMPEIDGFKLLEIIRVEMDLPVVIMSIDGERNIILKGVLDGACDYLIKPVRMDAVKVLWQHVLRKRQSKWKALEQQRLNLDTNRGNNDNILKTKSDDEHEGVASGKKRMIWTQDLHEKFVTVYNHLGPEKAVPMRILECMKKMNVPGITRENIASHLQKYRMHLQKQDVYPHRGRGHFSVSKVPRLLIPDPSPALGSHNLQICAAANQFPPQHRPTRQGNGRTMVTTINPVSGVVMPLDDQRNGLYSTMPGSSYYAIENSSTHSFPLNGSVGVGSSCGEVPSVAIPSYNEQHEYNSWGNVAQNLHSLSGDESYQLNCDATPHLPYDPPHHLQYFDQTETWQGPFMEQVAPPLMIENHGTWQFNK